MLRSLMTAVTGVRAHQTMLDVVGNNVANVNTTGYKKSSTVFQDLLYQTGRGATAPGDNRGGINPLQVGLGVQVAGVEMVNIAGPLQYTGNRTDIAISGDGFYVLSDGMSNLYTRAGNFTLDGRGTLVHIGTGFRVQGYEMVQDPSNPMNYIQGASLGDIRLQVGAKMEANETTVVGYRCNLDSTVGTYLPFGITNMDATATFKVREEFALPGQMPYREFTIVNNGSPGINIGEFVKYTITGPGGEVEVRLQITDIKDGKPVLELASDPSLERTGAENAMVQYFEGVLRIVDTSTDRPIWTADVLSGSNYTSFELENKAENRTHDVLLEFDRNASGSTMGATFWVKDYVPVEIGDVVANFDFPTTIADPVVVDPAVTVIAPGFPGDLIPVPDRDVVVGDTVTVTVPVAINTTVEINGQTVPVTVTVPAEVGIGITTAGAGSFDNTVNVNATFTGTVNVGGQTVPVTVDVPVDVRVVVDVDASGGVTVNDLSSGIIYTTGAAAAYNPTAGNPDSITVNVPVATNVTVEINGVNVPVPVTVNVPVPVRVEVTGTGTFTGTNNSARATGTYIETVVIDGRTFEVPVTVNVPVNVNVTVDVGPNGVTINNAVSEITLRDEPAVYPAAVSYMRNPPVKIDIPINPDGTFNIPDVGLDLIPMKTPDSGDFPALWEGGERIIIKPAASGRGIQLEAINDPGKLHELSIVSTTIQDMTATHATKLDVFDCQGIAYTLEVVYKKIGLNVWRWEAFFPNEPDLVPDPASGSLYFGPCGKLIDPPSADIAIPYSLKGSMNGKITLDFSGQSFGHNYAIEGVTQYGTSSTTKAYYQDGYAMGTMTDFSVAQNGVINGIYSNGKVIPLYRLALALFDNPTGLDRVGSTSFRESANSGIAQIGVPMEDGTGETIGGNLEMSNVDLAEEFTRLILAQRGFQANARIVTVSDSILEEAVNLKR